MRNRNVFLALCALALAAGGLWLAARGAGRERAAARPPAPAMRDAGPEEESPELAGALAAPVEIAAPAPLDEQPARVAVASERDAELARGLWVEGRVVFPPGTPPDERVEVVARGRKLKHGPPHAVRVAEDGSFRVAFGAGTKSGRLELKARYLYLEAPCVIAPPALSLIHI